MSERFWSPLSLSLFLPSVGGRRVGRRVGPLQIGLVVAVRARQPGGGIRYPLGCPVAQCTASASVCRLRRHPPPPQPSSPAAVAGPLPPSLPLRLLRRRPLLSRRRRDASCGGIRDGRGSVVDRNSAPSSVTPPHRPTDPLQSACTDPRPVASAVGFH